MSSLMKPPGVQIAADAWWSPLCFSLHYDYTSLGAVALGAAALVAAGVVALGAAALVALVAAAGSPSATGTPAGSDALLQLLQLETDMLHNSTSFLSWIGETSRVCPLLNGG